jgi:hypothetical protein
MPDEQYRNNARTTLSGAITNTAVYLAADQYVEGATGTSPS